ncbi:hypothetical protein RhiirA1_480323 [Rhizophagus irregularis]|uniref:C2H2-type domain-containing protein n=1 Tax=Rhizophagus irregularis TaxID=588596 RepID=A0A2N0QPG6_9GLOM|nr:hypothetical protein RhiirA1_480323 [Rhizophagus irregularis]
MEIPEQIQSSAGARPTDRAAPATADAGVAANNNHPIVFPEYLVNTSKHPNKKKTPIRFGKNPLDSEGEENDKAPFTLLPISMITVPHTPPHTPPPSNFFLCSTCGRQFKSSRGLTQHTRVIKKYNQRQGLDDVPANTISEFKEILVMEIHKKLVLNFRSMRKNKRKLQMYLSW